VEHGQTIVCLVVDNIRYTQGVAARVFTALGVANMRMTSQVASLLNLSFVVADGVAKRAVEALQVFEAVGYRWRSFAAGAYFTEEESQTGRSVPTHPKRTIAETGGFDWAAESWMSSSTSLARASEISFPRHRPQCAIHRRLLLERLAPSIARSKNHGLDLCILIRRPRLTFCRAGVPGTSRRRSFPVRV
jgi:hypothetical protein